METNQSYFQQTTYLVYILKKNPSNCGNFTNFYHRYKARHSRYIQQNSILHPLYFSCIRPELRRQGLISQIFEKSLEIASDYHYDTVVCEASTTQTALACAQLGFREV